MSFNPKYEEIIRAKYIWIYGAGKIGKSVVEEFVRADFANKICGVVVSDIEEQPDTIGQFDVKSVADINTKNQETLFILAISSKYQDEVKSILKERGYDNYLVWDGELRQNIWYFTEFDFIDRKKNYEKVCFVLSGYKEFLWDSVFERIRRFLPDDVEVCILSSGVYNVQLDKLAKNNGWSYLHTKINDLTLIQNIAITIFDKAEWIYKVDEDIFLTEGCFEKLFFRYSEVIEKEPYDVGFVAPLLPVNGYCYTYLLEQFKLMDDYVEKFGRAKSGGHPTRAIEWNPEAAKYMWGLTSEMPHLDRMNTIMEQIGGYSVCGLRFSIGFILFNRDIWYDMGGFHVFGTPDLGEDERNIIYWSVIKSRAMIIDHATVVGHFSFGKQTEAMKEFYDKHPEYFAIQEE